MKDFKVRVYNKQESVAHKFINECFCNKIVNFLFAECNFLRLADYFEK